MTAWSVDNISILMRRLGRTDLCPDMKVKMSLQDIAKIMNDVRLESAPKEHSDGRQKHPLEELIKSMNGVDL